MKISYNPKSSQNVIDAQSAANDDIIFDLKSSKLWAKGVRIGADWADITGKPTSLKNPASIRFKDINDNVITYDGSVAKDLTSGVNVAKLPYGFNSFASGVTWGNTIGTSFASWQDSTGGSIDFRRDNPSSGKMSIKVDGRVYVNEGANPVLSAESNNGFWGMRTPDGVNTYIRTPDEGLIPYISGVAGNGHSSLGTSTWYFSTAYIDKVFGNLKGNADTATKAFKADNATNADKLDGHHETYFMRTLDTMISDSDWNDNIKAGCYKVQNPSKNTPGNYNFGMGLTLATENNSDSEYRVCQIYFSHTHDYAMAVRTHNSTKGFAQDGSGWNSWALVPTTTGNIASATKLQTARSLWGNSFDGTKNITGSIVFPAIGNTAISNKISWKGSSDGADIYYQTTAQDQGNLVLNVADYANAYIQLALNGVFKSHFDVANSYWTGRSAQADKWTTARTFTIGNSAKSVDGSGNVSWSLAEMGVQNTWRPIQVNGTSIGTNTLNLSNSTYIGVSNNNGKVTFNLIGSTTTANQAILSDGTENGWKLETLNIANWNTAYDFVNNITGTDADNVINKWEEIVNFLAGITEDNKLNTLLNSKLSIQELHDNDILTTKTNNALFWASTIGTANHIPTGPFTKHPYALLSVTNFSKNDTNDKYFYRSRLAFSSAGDIKVASCHHQGEYKQDETWYNVLTSKNSGINGSTITLNDSSITVYSSDTADGRYVKKSGDTMTGALKFANYTWNQVGDDVYMGDHNIGGQLCIMGINGYTGLSFHKAGDASIRKSIVFDGNILYMNGNCDYATVANYSNLLALNTNPGKTISTHVGGWKPIKGRYVFCQNWHDTSTGEDNADFGIYLDGNLTANMVLDGYYNSSLGFRVIGASGGFLKANGTVDNNTYLTSHQSLSNYYTKGEINTKLSDYLPLSGGTMTGQISSNFSAGTWIAGCTNAIIKATGNSYNSLICAPIKSGNICISAWDQSDNLYFGYARKDKTENSFDTSMHWDAPNNTFYADAFAGYLHGTAESADKLDGYHASDLFTNLSNSNGGISITIGGTTKSISNISVNHATSAGSATKVIVIQHTTNDIDYPLVWSNQPNTSNVTDQQLFKSWKDLYYNPKNKKLTVAGSISTAYINATNTVRSAGFVHSAVTEDANQYVLTADGGYTRLNQTINEGEYSFSKDITVTDQWTDIDGFYGGNDSFLVTNGTYVVQVYYKTASANGMYDGYLSGIMSWYIGNTNSNNADEIVLHRAGHAYANTIYLRTAESPTPGYTKLQISANKTLSKNTYTFKFKRIC